MQNRTAKGAHLNWRCHWEPKFAKKTATSGAKVAKNGAKQAQRQPQGGARAPLLRPKGATFAPLVAVFLANFGSQGHLQFKCAPLAVRFCNFVVNYNTFLEAEKVSPGNKHILLYTPNWRAGTQFRVVWGRSIVGVRSLGGERGEHVTN